MLTYAKSTSAWRHGYRPADLAITLDIHRAGEVVCSGRASYSQMHRSSAELVEYLFWAAQFREAGRLNGYGDRPRV